MSASLQSSMCQLLIISRERLGTYHDLVIKIRIALGTAQQDCWWTMASQTPTGRTSISSPMQGCWEVCILMSSTEVAALMSGVHIIASRPAHYVVLENEASLGIKK